MIQNKRKKLNKNILLQTHLPSTFPYPKTSVPSSRYRFPLHANHEQVHLEEPDNKSFKNHGTNTYKAQSLSWHGSWVDTAPELTRFLSWNRGVPMASRRGPNWLAVFVLMQVLPMRLATVSTQGPFQLRRFALHAESSDFHRWNFVFSFLPGLSPTNVCFVFLLGSDERR